VTRYVYTIPLVLSLALASGCASRGAAIRAGRAAKEVVDVGAHALAEHIEVRVLICGEIPDLAERDACLGPIASHPDEVEAALVAVRAAQVALFLAISEGERDDRAAAIATLAVAVARLEGMLRSIGGAR
jgi:hypothetical protein